MKKLFLLQFIFLFSCLLINAGNLFASEYSFDKLVGGFVDSIMESDPAITDIKITDKSGADDISHVKGQKTFPDSSRVLTVFFTYKNVEGYDNVKAKWFIWSEGTWYDLGTKFLVPPLASNEGIFSISSTSGEPWQIGKYKIEIFSHDNVIGTTYFSIYKNDTDNSSEGKKIAVKKYRDVKLGVVITYPENWVIAGTMGNLALIDEKGKEQVSIKETYMRSRTMEE